MKKILITGGSGFIGSNLIEFLLKKNIKYLMLIKFQNFNSEKFKPKHKNYFLIKLI